MPDFGGHFIRSKGKPIEYSGTTVHLSHDFSVRDGQALCVQVEHVTNDIRQGLILKSDAGFTVGKERIPKAIVLWHDTAPPLVELIVHSKKGTCKVYNVWDTGKGFVDGCHFGAGMIVEQVPDGYRYRCNDYRPNDDFSDIIFKITLDVA